MKLQVQNKSEFLNQFLQPIAKINESAIVHLKDSKAYSYVTALDNSLFLYSEFNAPAPLGEVTLNLPQIPKLNQLLKLTDTEELDLDFSDNVIKYTSKGLRFKYRVFEDGIIQTPRYNIDKVNARTFDCYFTFTAGTVKKILKAVSIAGDVNCISFFRGEDGIVAQLSNRDTSSSNTIDLLVSEDPTGDLTKNISLNYETFKFALITANTSDVVEANTCEFNNDISDVPVVRMKVANEVGVAVLEIETDRTKLFYVMTGLQDNE